MTRTNRSMGEPPVLDPLADTESAARAAVAVEYARRRRHIEGVDGERLQTGDGPMAMLAAQIIASGMLVVAGLIGFAAYKQLDGRISGVGDQVRALADFRSCDGPPAEGDTAVITVRRQGGQLLTRCHLVPAIRKQAEPRSQM